MYPNDFPGSSAYTLVRTPEALYPPLNPALRLAMNTVIPGSVKIPNPRSRRGDGIEAFSQSRRQWRVPQEDQASVSRPVGRLAHEHIEHGPRPRNHDGGQGPLPFISMRSGLYPLCLIVTRLRVAVETIYIHSSYTIVRRRSPAGARKRSRRPTHGYFSRPSPLAEMAATDSP